MVVKILRIDISSSYTVCDGFYRMKFDHCSDIYFAVTSLHKRIIVTKPLPIYHVSLHHGALRKLARRHPIFNHLPLELPQTFQT